MRYRLLAFAILIGLVACAQPVRWQHPSAPQERWGADLDTCKRLAAREGQREYLKQQTLRGTDYTGKEESYDARMAAFEIRKFEAQLVEECMIRKGYAKATGDGR